MKQSSFYIISRHKIITTVINSAANGCDQTRFTSCVLHAFDVTAFYTLLVVLANSLFTYW